MSDADSSINLVMTVCETGVDDLDYIYKHTNYSISNQNMRYKGFAIKKTYQN